MVWSDVRGDYSVCADIVTITLVSTYIRTNAACSWNPWQGLFEADLFVHCGCDCAEQNGSEFA
jgi:hypothetical protein